ncbi:MAG: carboxypeptidase regulatory-like domain-containing protein [Blastocatellia bacterium]
MQRSIRMKLIVLGAFLLSASALIQAQNISGSITGTVRDAGGAVIPNATVRLEQTATGLTREAMTTDKGDFVFTALNAGEYKLTVSAAGFKGVERRGIVLTTAEYLSVGEIALAVGSVGESVTVTAQNETVQTASAERSGTITSDQVDNLLILGRNVTSLLSLLPGVVEPTASEGIDRNFNLNVQGNRNNTNNVSVDGVSLNAIGNNRNTSVSVSQDAVAEVKIQLSNFQAEYGRMSGANVTVITKSGTKQFHGGGSHFRRHEQFNANNFFSNRQGLNKPRYRYNVWNYNIGGPVVLPFWPGTSFNKGRDKLFFFFNQEWWPLETPNGVGRVTMPTELERQGDFSQTRDLNNALPNIVDPITRQPYADRRIPQNRLDPNGQALLKLFPLPNASDPARRFNYVFQTTNHSLQRLETLKLDYHYNSNNQVAFTFSGHHDEETGSQGLLTGGSANWPIIRKTFTNRGKFFGARYVRIISPTMVNELTLGYSTRPANETYDEQEIIRAQSAAVGFTLGQFNPASNPLGIIPNLTFGGVSQAANVAFEGRFPLSSGLRTAAITDNLTWTRGAHTMKAGIYIDRVYSRTTNPVIFNGSFDFSNNANNPVNSGHAYANALFGVFNSYSEVSARPRLNARGGNVEWFAQDNWKVTSRLTLDYGLRFALVRPLTERDDRVAAFNPLFFNPALTVRLITPRTVGGVRAGVDPLTGTVFPAAFIGGVAPGSGDPNNGMVVAATGDVPRAFIPDRGLHYGPRIGFAYDLTGKGKMAVRGGFGVYYNRQGLDVVLLPFSTQPPLARTPVIQFGSFATLRSTGEIATPQGVSGLDDIGKVPTVMNFSLGIQRSLGFKTILDLAYVGSLGRHLPWARDINPIPLGANFDPANNDPTTNRPLPGNFLRPIKGYGAINIREFAASSNYHSMQLSINRRFGQQLQFGGSWTWSKSLNYNSADGGAVTSLAPIRVYNYGLSNFDRTHVVKINYLYSLPKAGWENPLAQYLINGWQVSGITSFVSGAPEGVTFTLVSGIDFTGSASITPRLDIVANPVLPKGERTFSRNFNTDAFRLPARGTLGTASPAPIRGPGINNHDIAFFKNFRFFEKLNLQFRGELYNVFNHTQFSEFDTAARFDASGNQINARLGEFTAARRARLMQFALKLQF